MKTEQVQIKIEVEGKPAYMHAYEKQVAEEAKDIQLIAFARADGKDEDERKENALAYMVRAFNYGHDLIVRQSERSKATKAAQGPEKQIAKAVEMLVSQGFDAAVAREMIIKQREAKGLPV